MKKLLFIFCLYLLVEGDYVIGDGLYLFHRGSHAVDQLKTKVDEYYPKVKAVDREMSATIDGEFHPDDSLAYSSPRPGRI